VELRQLRYFLVLAEELHFHRAAKRLFVAQPALSRQIQQLEEEIGVLLFRRNRRLVEITEAGKLFVQRARQVLADLEHATQDARNLERGLAGRLTFSFVPSASYILLPAILKMFRVQYPDVELNLLELSTAQQLDALSRNQSDIALLHPWKHEVRVVYKRLMTEPFVVACPEDHPHAGKKSIPLKSFANDRFIMIPRWLGPTVSGMYEVTAELLRNAGVEPNIAPEAPAQLHAALGLVNAGFGVALVPRSLMQLPMEGISYAGIREKSPTNELGLAWLPGNTNPILPSFSKAAFAAAKLLANGDQDRTGSRKPKGSRAVTQ
jgi:DNA-binding transcriptional LysR family regulator